jgi:oligopeptide transport system ATP-binding protein
LEFVLQNTTLSKPVIVYFRNQWVKRIRSQILNIVSIQAKIITMLMRLREELKLTYLFIAHDLSVVRNISDLVAMMYIVEITASATLYTNPLHPYTISLLSAVPIPDPVIDRTRERIVLTGDVPSPVNPPSGCPFHPRCFEAIDICKEQVPELRNIGGEHWVSRHCV